MCHHVNGNFDAVRLPKVGDSFQVYLHSFFYWLELFLFLGYYLSSPYLPHLYLYFTILADYTSIFTYTHPSSTIIHVIYLLGITSCKHLYCTFS